MSERFGDADACRVLARAVALSLAQPADAGSAGGLRDPEADLSAFDRLASGLPAAPSIYSRTWLTYTDQVRSALSVDGSDDAERLIALIREAPAAAPDQTESVSNLAEAIRAHIFEAGGGLARTATGTYALECLLSASGPFARPSGQPVSQQLDLLAAHIGRIPDARRLERLAAIAPESDRLGTLKAENATASLLAALLRASAWAHLRSDPSVLLSAAHDAGSAASTAVRALEHAVSLLPSRRAPGFGQLIEALFYRGYSRRLRDDLTAANDLARHLGGTAK